MVMVVFFVWTGKTPPNLSQGVPPLLPNQYIMGPGGLLPAYPVSRPSSLVILVWFHRKDIYKGFFHNPLGRFVTDGACCLCFTADLWL